MSELPILKARKLIRALERAGFQEIRRRGSHRFFRHPISGYTTVVAVHGGEDIDRSLLADILDDIHMSAEELRKFL